MEIEVSSDRFESFLALESLLSNTGWTDYSKNHREGQTSAQG